MLVNTYRSVVKLGWNPHMEEEGSVTREKREKRSG